MMRKSFTLELQEHPLRNVSGVTCETSNNSNTKIALNYQNIYGNSKMLIILPVTEWSIVTKLLSKTQLNFCHVMSLWEILNNKVIEWP